MTSRCLGARVADLADGRLSPAETERAYAHVAACPGCRAALEAQRTASAVLRADSEAEPPVDLLAGLRAIGAEPAQTPSPLIPAQSASGPSGRAGTHPRGLPSSSRRGPGRRIALAGAAGAAALAVVAAIGVGGAGAGVVTPPTPSIAPVVDMFTVEHSVAVDRLPFGGPRLETAAYADTPASVPPSPAP